MTVTELEVPTQARRAAMREDPVLVRALAGIRRLYGDRLVRIVLFGSRARGEERPDSDYDIAVILTDYDWIWGEVKRLAGLTWEILMDTGAEVRAFPIPVEDLSPDRLFTFNIIEEGIDL